MSISSDFLLRFELKIYTPVDGF